MRAQQTEFARRDRLIRTGTSILLLLLGIIVSGSVGKKIYTEHQAQTILDRSAVRVEGTVVSHKIIRDRFSTYYITYRFTTLPEHGAQSITRQDEVSRTRYDSLQPDDPVSVVYAGENPSIARLEPEKANEHDTGLIAVWVIRLAAIVILLFSFCEQYSSRLEN